MGQIYQIKTSRLNYWLRCYDETPYNQKSPRTKSTTQEGKMIDFYELPLSFSQ